jgi:ATPase family AAA domain-containing protein 1
MGVMKVVIQHTGYVVLTVILVAVASPKYTRADASLHRRDSDRTSTTTTSTSSSSSSPSISNPSTLHNVGSGGVAATKQFVSGNALSSSAALSQTSGGSNNNISTRSSHNDQEKLAIFVVDLVFPLVVLSGASFVASKIIRGLQNSLSGGDPDDGSVNAKAVRNRLSVMLAKRNITTIPTLTHRENQMAEEILNPDDIDASFSQIGGLDRIKQEIYDLAVFPLVYPLYFSNSKLRQPPKGILLYGKPGTGKTMLAKAIAKEAQAVFLPLQLSKILNKYWGESNKLIAATFSLAYKLQPAVIFIDELDTFLKNSNSETAYMDSIKAEFLTLWDGVATSASCRVLVLGATNKPQHIDDAILRRMPRAFEVPLPDETGRLAILKLILDNESLETTAREYLSVLAERTKKYSGSDLKELCRAAAMVPVQERTAEFCRRRVMGEVTSSSDTMLQNDQEPIRPITVRDLELGLQKVQRSGEAAKQYGARENNGDNGVANGHNNNSRNHIRMDEATVRQLTALIQGLFSHNHAPTSTKPSPYNEDRIPNL